MRNCDRQNHFNSPTWLVAENNLSHSSGLMASRLD